MTGENNLKSVKPFIMLLILKRQYQKSGVNVWTKKIMVKQVQQKPIDKEQEKLKKLQAQDRRNG